LREVYSLNQDVDWLAGRVRNIERHVWGQPRKPTGLNGVPIHMKNHLVGLEGQILRHAKMIGPVVGHPIRRLSQRWHAVSLKAPGITSNTGNAVGTKLEIDET
jgi:hypothetical protein